MMYSIVIIFGNCGKVGGILNSSIFASGYKSPTQPVVGELVVACLYQMVFSEES